MASSTRWCAPASPATITRWTSCSATTRSSSSGAPSTGAVVGPGPRVQGDPPHEGAPSRSGWPAAWPAAARRPARRRRAGSARARWHARAMARAATRQAISRTDSPSQVTATRCAPMGVRSRALSSRNATTVVSVAAWNTAGASSRVLLRSSSSSRRYSPDVVLMRTISGSSASAVTPGPKRPEDPDRPAPRRAGPRARRRPPARGGRPDRGAGPPSARGSRPAASIRVARRPPRAGAEPAWRGTDWRSTPAVNTRGMDCRCLHDARPEHIPAPIRAERGPPPFRRLFQRRGALSQATQISPANTRVDSQAAATDGESGCDERRDPPLLARLRPSGEPTALRLPHFA